MRAVDDLADRGRTSLRTRVARARSKLWVVGQCAVAAGVAWWVAKDVFDHPTPFFAPIAAVVSLGTSYGQRLRRVTEVTVGVAVGVLLGDLATLYVGSEAWVISLIVAVGMMAALLLDAGVVLRMQVAVQGIVVATLAPAPGDAFLRWTDALIGGGVALVAATVVPRAPLRRPREQAAEVVHKVAELLRAASDVLVDGDVDRAMAVLRDARSTEGLIIELRAAADEGLSVVRSSPFRRRHSEPLRQLVQVVDPLDIALRNTRVIVRRVALAAHRRTPVPPSHAAICRDLAGIVEIIAAELEQGRQPTAAIHPLLALGQATANIESTSDLTSEVILAQVRSVVADLLALCGMDPLEATDALPPR